MFLAASNQNKIYIIHCGIAEKKKSRLLSSEQRSYTSIKLEKAVIDMCGHPQDGHQLVVMFVDGIVQGLLLEGGSVTREYTIGGGLQHQPPVVLFCFISSRIHVQARNVPNQGWSIGTCRYEYSNTVHHVFLQNLIQLLGQDTWLLYHILLRQARPFS